MSHPTCEVPFPPRRSGEYRKGMIPARPLYQGGCGSVWDPEPSKERVGDWSYWGGPATVWSLLCAAETRATRPNGEWGYSTRRQCWANSAQRRCHPEEAVYSIDRPFIVLTDTKSSNRHIPVWARYSPHQTRVEGTWKYQYEEQVAAAAGRNAVLDWCVNMNSVPDCIDGKRPRTLP